MTNGNELKTPIELISKFPIAMEKLFPKSGVMLRSVKHTNVIANTIQILIANERKDEKRSALSVRGSENGNTIKNYKYIDEMSDILLHKI